MASILFAHPLFLAQNKDEQAAASPYFPLGLLYLAGYVRDQGHDVAIFDGTFAVDESEFAACLEQQRPDVVGLSALVTTRASALRLATMASSFGAAVIVGGPDPTFDPGVYLAHHDVDVVVHHEGEQTIARLLDLVDDAALGLESLTSELGVAFRAGGGVTVNEPRPPIEDLDQLPMPARDLIDMDRYLDQWRDDQGYTSITVSTTRGCPYGCEWCSDSVHGTGFRQRSPESVAAEVKHLKDTYNVESLRLVDDVDELDRSWVNAWADEARRLDAEVSFEALNKLRRTDLPLLEVRDSL